MHAHAHAAVILGANGPLALAELLSVAQALETWVL
jgi:hypothetical protein